MLPLTTMGQASLVQYPRYVATLEEFTGINVGFRPYGTLRAIFERHAREELNTEIALHHGLGLSAEPLRSSEALELEPALSPEIAAAILRPDEASVDSRLLTSALLEAARCSGVAVFHGKPATSIWKDRNRCKGLRVAGEKVEAKWSVIAAGAFSAGIEGAAIYAPVVPAKGQMVSLRCPGIRIERVLWSDEIYLVPRNDGRILAGATVERIGFNRDVTAGGISALLRDAIELVPSLSRATIDETWAGLRPDTPDHLPILGPCDLEGLLFATGHFRSGILLIPITARLIRSWITTQYSPIDWDRFSPMRFQSAAHTAI